MTGWARLEVDSDQSPLLAPLLHYLDLRGRPNRGATKSKKPHNPLGERCGAGVGADHPYGVRVGRFRPDVCELFTALFLKVLLRTALVSLPGSCIPCGQWSAIYGILCPNLHPLTSRHLAIRLIPDQVAI